jgi:predicted CXXCH cytochrome family protein
MQERDLQFRPLVSRDRTKLAAGSAVALGGLLLVVQALVSCGTVTRTVVVMPSIPGAEYIGTAMCADCHYELVEDFRTASHARTLAPGPNAIEAGCEGCHGPGSLHSDSGGEPGTIINPGKSPDICFTCHLNTRGAFSLPYRHPVPEGRMTCGECHDPHRGGDLRWGGTAMISENEACLACHPAQRGPYVFEHEAMREGCSICHHAHGSVNAKLLSQRNAVLCLKCHFQQQTAAGQLLIGGVNHASFVNQGTCWSAGCHEAVHGSQVNSSLRY